MSQDDANKTDTNTPNEEQIEEQRDAENALWKDDFDPESLKIKYSNDDDTKEETPEEGKDDKTQITTSDDDDDEVEIEQFDDPVPIITVEDPGEYKEKDYSFEIEIEGKKHKVTSADEADELADKYADKLTANQLGTLIRKGAQIEIKQDRDKSDWQKQKDKFNEQTKAEDERWDDVNKKAREFKYMVSKNMIPAIPKEFEEADWNDPQVQKQPGVKEHIEILTYMAKENLARKKADLDPITSVLDAFNAMKVDEGYKKKEEDKKAAGEARREAGSRVAGVSAGSNNTYAPKGIAVGNPNALKRGAAIWEN